MGLKCRADTLFIICSISLKSDQNGIEILVVSPGLGRGLALKSDQNGIEIYLHHSGFVDAFLLKSDQNGIEIQESINIINKLVKS